MIREVFGKGARPAKVRQWHEEVVEREGGPRVLENWLYCFKAENGDSANRRNNKNDNNNSEEDDNNEN